MTKYIVKKCFVARKDYVLIEIDYKAMEYRLFLNYAGEKGVIKEILENGLDPHAAIARQIDITRREAKAVNFGLLYGMGSIALAADLKINVNEAIGLKRQYFNKLPRVKQFIQYVNGYAERNGCVINCFGRVCAFTEPTHKTVNYLIQGGCADIVKLAMVRLDEYLKDKKTRMLLQVHDSIIFELHKSEYHYCDNIIRIMETAYKHKYLPLTVDIKIGDNLGEMVTFERSKYV